MSRQNPWTRHFQSVWQERAGDPRLPAWLRVACLAYGSHAANGHAVFKPGQIGLVLGRVNPQTGEVKPMDKGSVQRAIRAAVDYGWLSDASGARCLVVPGHAIQGGMKGSPTAECPQHKVRTQRPPKGSRVGTHRLPSRRSAPTNNTLTCTDATPLYDSSNRNLTVEPDPAGTPLTRKAKAS